MKTILKVALVTVCLLSVTLVSFPISASADWKDISNSIRSELDASPTLGDHEIDIHVRHGQVELTGQVASIDDSREIEQIARHTKGVDGVQNGLKVNTALLANGNRANNFKISTDIVDRISRDQTLGLHSYTVVARNGRVTISGQVASVDDQKRIEQIARSTPGVTQVELALQPLIASDDSSLAARVHQDLATKNGIDLSGIGIAANNGVVTFSGTRSNHRQIDHILSLALMVPGVKDIRSEMRLDGSPDSQAHKTYSRDKEGVKH